MTFSPDTFRLNGKNIIVTGGAGLLGEQHAEAILQFGGTPVLLDINEQDGLLKAKKLSERYQRPCHFYSVDLTDEKALMKVAELIVSQVGDVFGLINNAAVDYKAGTFDNKATRVEHFPVERWIKDISVGLTGAFLCSKVFGALMARAGKGVILNIASDLGVNAPDQRIYRQPGLADDEQPAKPISYSVAKGGLISMTKYLATYWVEKNIRVNCLSPGGVFTNQNKEFVSKLTNLIPMGRMANLDEYRGAIVFLLSDASSYMTGQNILIDGGRSAW